MTNSRNNVDVELRPHEIRAAGHIAVERLTQGIRLGFKETYGHDRNDAPADMILGAVGEMAAAKYLGIYHNQFTEQDDGPHGDICGVDVRTRRKIDHDLLLHRRDTPHRPCVLAIVVWERMPVVRLAGWTYTREGQKEEYWRELQKGRPCYVYPQKKLAPMSTLRAMTHNDLEARWNTDDVELPF